MSDTVSGAAVEDDSVGAPDPYRVVLAIFIGPNAEKFLKVYDKAGGDLSRVPMGWLWAPLFVPFPWLLYRKLYIEAAVLFVGYFGVSFIAPITGIAIGLLFGILIVLLGKSYYLQKADRKIRRILDEGGDVDVVEERIAKAGGVEKSKAWAGAVIQAVTIAAGIGVNYWGQIGQQ